MKTQFVLPLALCAASILVGTPALAQMKTSKTPSAVAAPVASDSVVETAATDSITADAASGSMMVSTPTLIATASPATIASAPASGGGFSLPTIPHIPFLDISVGAEFDGLGMGSATLKGLESVTSTTTAPPLAPVNAAIPSLATGTSGGGGMGLGADVGFLFLGAGIRQQTLSLDNFQPAANFDTTSFPTVTNTTYTPPTTMDALLPSSYTDLYLRALMFKVGIRNEHYNGTSKFSGDYSDMMGGVNLGFSLFDFIGINASAMTGIATSKPAALDSTTMHMPLDGDAYVSLKIMALKARVGYKAIGAVNADPTKLSAVVQGMMDPKSLLDVAKNGASVDAATVNKVGLWTGPYLSLELCF